MAIIEDLGARYIGPHDPSKTYTLSDFIEYGKQDDLTYKNFSILMSANSITFAEQCITDYYMDDLRSIAYTVTKFTEDEKTRYKYRPDLLAYDIYGTTQLDFIILLCNGIIDPKEFDFKRGYIKLLTRTRLKSLLSDIYNAEYDWISLNRNAIKPTSTTSTK